MRQPESHLDENRLDRDTPVLCNLRNELFDLVGDGLAFGNDALKRASANDGPEGRLRALNEGTLDVKDAEGRAVRRCNLPADHRVDLNVDVVLGHDLRGEGRRGAQPTDQERWRQHAPFDEGRC